MPRDDEWIFSLSLLADVSARLGDAPRTGTLYRLLVPYAARNAVSNPDMCIGSVSRSLAILAARAGHWREAVGHFEDALAMNARAGAQPWVIRVQHDFARSLLARGARHDRERARELLAAALETARALELTALAATTARLVEREGIPRSAGSTATGRAIVRRGTHRPAVFRRQGEYWSIAYEGEVVRLKDAKGLRYLAQLLAEPDREFHVLDLVVSAGEPPDGASSAGASAEGRTLVLGDAGAILDRRAKREYRRRLAELRDEIREAEAWGDRERAARAGEEITFLARQLASAVGFGSRDRRALAVAERARVNVTRAMKAALLRVRRSSASLGRHLDATVKTGIFCSYTPDPRASVTWHV